MSDKITPFLWFDSDAEEATAFYAGLFPDSEIHELTRYGAGGPGTEGSVMTVEFSLAGRRFVALNGGPGHPFTDAFSLSVDCADQAEVDHYWAALGEGGREVACGWLQDRYGLSWQIVPKVLPRLLASPDRAAAQRVMTAMLDMVKLDVAELERAAAG